MSGNEASGFADAGFAAVKEAFEANYQRDDIYRETGSALCVYYRGAPVVDIWAGHADPETGRPWTVDTTACVYSTTKALTALCVAMLVDRGVFSYTDKVSGCWPSFGCNGKEETTVSQLMSHQSGNPALRKTIAYDDLMNWPLICDLLAAQEPYWEPGEKTGYHGWTYGFLAGELVRRAAGVSIGAFLQREIAGPLGAEAYIGLPAEKDDAAAVLLAPKGDKVVRDLTDAPDYFVAALSNPVFDPLAPNRREWRASEQAANGGFASARGLATIFAALAEGGALHGVDLISRGGIEKMTQVVSSRPDVVFSFPVDWAHGVLLNSFGLYGPNPKAFGHTGWGGSFVCCDEENRIAIGYVCNQMGPDVVGDPRTRKIVDAIYQCID